MGILTVNINNYTSTGNTGQPENERRPPKKSGSKTWWLELLLGVAMTFKADPYMNAAKAAVTQVLEVLTLTPEHAVFWAAVLCFTVVCAAPMVLMKVGRYLFTE